MMTKLKVFLLCAATAALTFGLTLAVESTRKTTEPCSLVINGPAMVNKGGIVQFNAVVKNPSWFLTKTVYQWKVLHKDGELKYNSLGDNGIYLPAGVNSDKLFVITSAVNYHNYLLWGSVSPLDTKVSVVSVGDPVPPGPGPGPGPNPPPPPDPTPVSVPLFAVLIHDSTTDINLTPGQLALKNSQTIQAKLKQLNTSWKIYDKANPVLADPKWQAAITKAGLPGLFLVDKDGKQYNIGNEKVVNEDSTVLEVQSLRGNK
jgi:hypothetical protein